MNPDFVVISFGNIGRFARCAPRQTAREYPSVRAFLGEDLKFLDSDVAEAVKLSFFTVMLKTDVSCGIQIVG